MQFLFEYQGIWEVVAGYVKLVYQANLSHKDVLRQIIKLIFLYKREIIKLIFS